MKKSIMKLTSLLLTVIICFGCFTGGFSVSAEEKSDIAQSNFDFAVKTAEIIKNNEDSMLRIIGKLRSEFSGFDFPYDSDCVVSEDGRFVLQFSAEKELESCLKFLQNNPNVIYAERDIPVYTGDAEESAPLSWGVEAIEADIYSKAIIPEGENSVTVAIVDSGVAEIDFFKDNLVQGYDFFENDSDAFQDTSKDSHGTFLASIVADCIGNLPIKIMPVRVLENDEAFLINVINGIIYAVDNGADVINLSLCANLMNCKSLEDSIDYAYNHGVTVVVCAGNLKSNVTYFCPSHIDNVITVSSVNSDLIFSEAFSNFGKEIDLAAPGEYIMGYNAKGESVGLNGTSMATAFISAAASMYILNNPLATNPENVKSALISCAKDLGEEGKDDYYGWGIPKLGSMAIEAPEITASIKIRNNIGNKAINYGETLRLTAEITEQPENTTVWWYVDGVKKGEGFGFDVSPKSGSIEVSAKLVDSNGTILSYKDGREISDSQKVSVNSGFFQKLISFFKNLFGINRTVVQVI